MIYLRIGAGRPPQSSDAPFDLEDLTVGEPFWPPSFPSLGCFWTAWLFWSFDPLLLLLLVKALIRNVPFGLKTLVPLVQNIESLLHVGVCENV